MLHAARISVAISENCRRARILDGADQRDCKGDPAQFEIDSALQVMQAPCVTTLLTLIPLLSKPTAEGNSVCAEFTRTSGFVIATDTELGPVFSQSAYNSH
jgi:hypothetical protein